MLNTRKAAPAIPTSINSSSVQPVLNKDISFFTKSACSGAIAACFTHFIMIPVDVVKTRMQLNPSHYPSTSSALRTVLRNEGIKGLCLGMGPTNYGYLVQGAYKYGLYEYFKHTFPQWIGGEMGERNKHFIYLMAGMTAEGIADVFLTPFEAVRIRMVADPSFSTSTVSGMKRILTEEGMKGLYRGFLPLAMKQIPYTAVKLTVFEATEESIYQRLPPRNELSHSTQLGVTAFSGFVGGVISAIASHPADTLLTQVNKSEGGGIVASIKAMGLRGVWAGIGPRMGMVGVLGSLQLLVYDAAKVTLFGLPTSQGITTKSTSNN